MKHPEIRAYVPVYTRLSHKPTKFQATRPRSTAEDYCFRGLILHISPVKPWLTNRKSKSICLQVEVPFLDSAGVALPQPQRLYRAKRGGRTSRLFETYLESYTYTVWRRRANFHPGADRKAFWNV